MPINLESPSSTTMRLWDVRPRLGPHPYYTDANELWLDCVSYFEWAEASPVLTIDVVKYQGEAIVVDVPYPRPLTQVGLCAFLGVDPTTWRSWRRREDEDIIHVISMVDAIIFEQKFTGAAVGMYNPSLIARELGLMHKEAEDPLLFPPEDIPLITRDMSPSEAAELYARGLEG